MTTELIRKLQDASEDLHGHLADTMRDTCREKFGVIISFDDSRTMANGAIAALSAHHKEQSK